MAGPPPDRRREIVLRREVAGENHYLLVASVAPDGSLILEGQDLGPITAAAGSDDGEYEYVKTIRVEHLPRLRELLGIHADDDLLEALGERWSGEASWSLEALLREHNVPVELHTR